MVGQPEIFSAANSRGVTGQRNRLADTHQHSFTRAGALCLDNFFWVTEVSWAVVNWGREGPAYFGPGDLPLRDERS